MRTPVLRLFRCFACLAFPVLCARGQIEVFHADFEQTAAGPEWSTRTISVTPAGTRRFLGPFGAETVKLTVPGLPSHSFMTLRFDLFLIQSWDGSDPDFGPDIWDLSVPSERNLIHTTFSNTTNGTEPQAWPDVYPRSSNPALSGAAERNSLGYPPVSSFPGVNDSVYHMKLSFAHSGSSIVLAFAGAPFETIDNESWGLDNVSISVESPAAGVIEFSSPVYYVREAEGNARVTVNRSGALDLPASVDYATSAGTANSAFDYSAASGTLVFAPGETTKTISVPILPDDLPEVRDETIFVQLKNVSSGAVLGNPVASAITIMDDDTDDIHFAKSAAPPDCCEGGDSFGVAWGDFDGDGRLDLFVPNSGPQASYLYRNTTTGSFEKVTTGLISSEVGNATGAAWCDYDNDGDLDLLVTRWGTNALYRNNGNGTFARVTTGGIVTTTANFNGCAWADYDNDGNADIFLITNSGANLLFHNNGNGSFTRVTSGSIVSDSASSMTCAWADYDGDGFPDLFVGNRTGQPNFLYHNLGNGTFARVTSSPIGTDQGNSYGCAWGDYDNDGRLDLFVSNFGLKNFLYHNKGGGSFEKVATGVIATDNKYSLACGWVDIDNDGDLDLFVAEFAAGSSLYLNNGNGTFSRKAQSELSMDYNPSGGIAWADFDNDGDNDLFVSRYYNQNNALFINEGTTNQFLKIRLRGTLSNGSGIGARIKVTTQIEDTEQSQIRIISGGSGTSQDAMEAQFGLGNATRVNRLEILWPSGVVQSWTDLPVNKSLEITEAPQLTARIPAGTLDVLARPGAKVLIENSSDLTLWTSALSTNAPGSAFTLKDPTALAATARFYRSKYQR